MAFKLAQKPTYTATVKVHTANDKDGFDTSEFKAKLKRVNMDELQKLHAMPNKDVVKDVLVGWSDLVDEDGAEVDFNETNLEALLLVPQAVKAIAEKFWETQFKAAEKD